MTTPSNFGFWQQAALLALGVVVLHVRGEWRASGRWPTAWRQWREVIASVVVCVAIFGVISGGRGCASSPWPDDSVEPYPDPDPFRR